MFAQLAVKMAVAVSLCASTTLAQGVNAKETMDTLKKVFYMASCERTIKAHMANGNITVGADATDERIVYFCEDVVAHTDLDCMTRCVEASGQPGAKAPTVARKKGQPAPTEQEKDDLRIGACFTKCHIGR